MSGQQPFDENGQERSSRGMPLGSLERFLLLSGCLFLSFVASAQPQPLVFTVGPEEVVATREELTRAVPTNHSWPDSPLGVIKADDANPPHYWFVASGGDGLGSPGMTHGTLDHIVSGNLVYPVSPMLDMKSKRPVVPEKCTYAGSGPFYTDSRSGLFIQFVHMEMSFGSAEDNSGVAPFYSKLGLAVSSNRGKTWHYVGDIVSTTVSLSDWKTYVGEKPSAPWLDIGSGAHVIVADKGVSYFYVYIRDFPRPANQETPHLAVARAPVADVVAAAAKGKTVVWKKYYKSRWDEPGLGGKSSPLETGHTPNDMQVDVKYNSYLKKYIMATGSIIDVPGYLELTTSKDGLTWAPRARVTESLTPDNQQAIITYPSIVGTDSDPSKPGKTFYIYATKHAFEQDQLEVTRRKITLR
jgi:hypothetical protein